MHAVMDTVCMCVCVCVVCCCSHTCVRPSELARVQEGSPVLYPPVLGVISCPVHLVNGLLRGTHRQHKAIVPALVCISMRAHARTCVVRACRCVCCGGGTAMLCLLVQCDCVPVRVTGSRSLLHPSPWCKDACACTHTHTHTHKHTHTHTQKYI